jgi:hypothetical protein
MRYLHLLGWLAWGGCAAEPEPEPEPRGETIWQTLGGLCDGPCPHARLQQDGDALQLLRDTDQGIVEATGTWTEAGSTEYAEASAETYPVREDEFYTCRGTDGIDVQIVLAHEQTTWTTEYCSHGEPPSALARADALFDAVVGALTDGHAHDYITVD